MEPLVGLFSALYEVEMFADDRSGFPSCSGVGGGDLKSKDGWFLTSTGRNALRSTNDAPNPT